jgi:hypothetical protein
VTELVLPSVLSDLLASGAWPMTAAEANRENLSSAPIPPALVEQLVPGEAALYLYPPPFYTIAQRCEGHEAEFWNEHGALHEIDSARAVLIGDFGLGSDTAIALDYRARQAPPLIRLAWFAERPRTRWVPCFESFAGFALTFDLHRRRWR